MLSSYLDSPMAPVAILPMMFGIIVGALLLWRKILYARTMRLIRKESPDPLLYINRFSLTGPCKDMLEASIQRADSKLAMVSEWRSFITFLAINLHHQRKSLVFLLFEIWSMSVDRPYRFKEQAEQLSAACRYSLLDNVNDKVIDCYPIEIIAALNAALEPYERTRHLLYYKS